MWVETPDYEWGPLGRLNNQGNTPVGETRNAKPSLQSWAPGSECTESQYTYLNLPTHFLYLVRNSPMSSSTHGPESGKLFNYLKVSALLGAQDWLRLNIFLLKMTHTHLLPFQGICKKLCLISRV